MSEKDCNGKASNEPDSKTPLNVDNINRTNGIANVSLKKRKTPKVDEKNDGRVRNYTLPLFIVNMGALILIYMMINIYGNGVIRTLERRFGLRSAQTGMIQSANDIIHVCIVVFVGYFGRKAHKPRIISVTILASVVGGFMMASPHFLLSSYVSPHDQQTRRSLAAFYGNTTDDDDTSKFCLQRKPTLGTENTSIQVVSGDDCDNTESSSSAVHPAYYIFLTAQFISGIGGSGIHTLSLAYIDENSPGSKSSLYIGIFSSMYAFGPMFGMLLAAVTLRLPENLLSPAEGDTRDPSWIGCWWLGYVICACGLLVTSIPLWFFPKSIRTAKERNIENNDKIKKEEEETSTKVKDQILEFPRRLLHLLRNKAYIVNLFSVVCGAYIIFGIYVNTVRYIEIHFLERAFVGSIIAGLVSALAGAIGGFTGGMIMSRFRIRPPGAVKMMLLSSGIFIIGIIIILNLGCPQLEMAGQHDPEDDRFTVETDCNSHCACSTSRIAYSPVCGSDNLTYFSACTAGCKEFSNGTFLDCDCISSATDDENSFARPGLCRPPCQLLIPFAITLFLMSLFGGMSRVPSTIVNFRIVDDDERSFALSINSFALNLLGFVPAPLLIGSLIDSTCILWQTTCKKTGSCLLFDTTRFRHRTYGVALVFELVDFSLVCVLFFLIRKMAFRTGKEKVVVEQPILEKKYQMEEMEIMETTI